MYGDKDNDGFYRGEIRGKCGLIPCNMVSEIRAEDDETMEQLMKQGFLPLNTPVDRVGKCISQFSTKMSNLQNITKYNLSSLLLLIV